MKARSWSFEIYFVMLLWAGVAAAWPFHGGGGGGPTLGCTMSYTGVGDIAPATGGLWAGLRAYSTAKCGAKFANVCVQVSAVDTCQDMVTSTTTGAIVPLSTGFGGTTCPNSSGTCTFAKLYDQTAGNNCGGSCDLVQATVANRFKFVSGVAACQQAPICIDGANASMTTAGSLTLAQPFSLGFVGYWVTMTEPVFTAHMRIGSGPALQNNGVDANHYYFGCGTNEAAIDVGASMPIFDATLTCPTGSTSNFYMYNLFMQSVSGTIGTQTGVLTFGWIDTDEKMYLEVDVSSVDLTSSIASLNANRRAFWGF